MGAWGTAIFSEDSASDVRDEWREAILDGLSPEDATQRLLETFDDHLEEADTERLFWMALAAAQMETGRLLPDVCDRALAIIDGGGDVDRWREDGDESLARQRARTRAFGSEVARPATEAETPAPPGRAVRAARSRRRRARTGAAGGRERGLGRRRRPRRRPGSRRSLPDRCTARATDNQVLSKRYFGIVVVIDNNGRTNGDVLLTIDGDSGRGHFTAAA